MFCVTVTPASRTLAKVDLLNAARTGDLVELCLDHLIKEPDFTDLLNGLTKPVLVSCRRKGQGGQFCGSEQDRVMLLKRAIVAGPRYIELDPTAAAQVPRFGDVRRVIAFTDTTASHADPEALLDEARGLNADVVKFAWPMPTLEDGWPLLKMVAKKRSLPVVGTGLGQAEATFALLGRKYGAPWVYAALERGMEAHPGQPTISDMRDLYAADEIDGQTAFVAVTGFGASSLLTVRTLNDAFRRRSVNARCLPVEAQDAMRFGKRLDALKVKAVLATGPTRKVATGLTPGQSPADVYLKKSAAWQGYRSLGEAATRALDAAVGDQWPRRSSLVLGCSEVAKSVAGVIVERGGVVNVCAPDDRAAAGIAAAVGCRHVPFQGVYSALTDVLVVADPDLTIGDGRRDIRPGYLRGGMVVADLTDPPNDSDLMAEARERGCRLVDPLDTYERHLRATFRTLSGGHDLPVESFDLAKQSVLEARSSREPAFR